MGALTDHNNMGWLELTLKHHTVIMDMRFFQAFVVGCPFIICFQSIGTYSICVAGVLAYRVGPSKIHNDPLSMHKLRYQFECRGMGTIRIKC